MINCLSITIFHMIVAVFDLTAQAAAGPALAQTFAGPALAEARVQDWSQLAPAANQALSSAETKIGNSIVSKLDSILKDPTDHRPGKKRCLNHMDLQLIVDSSGSIGRTQFNNVKRAMKVRILLYSLYSQHGVLGCSKLTPTCLDFYQISEHFKRNNNNNKTNTTTTTKVNYAQILMQYKLTIARIYS